ncbi:MAG: bifunctional glutamate N-acetyltransferase/amino-acid acetyltransferase ArgJ [Bacillota bacterium]
MQKVDGGITAARGYLAAGVAAGIKNGKRDVAVLYSREPAVAAGVFTTNRVKAAPLLVTMGRLKNNRARAVVVNSGNANACNGSRGLADAAAMAGETARLLGLPEDEVLVSSTGVIGQPLPMAKIIPGIQRAVAELSPGGGADAARAIMTTDLVPKEYAVKVEIGGREVIVGGMCKGSGMIHPNMATMLGFVTTDAAVSPAALTRALRQAVDDSFNMITVDGDTSTNDMVLLLANGAAGNPEIRAMGAEYDLFLAAITEVCARLAMAVAQDGEGATKLLEIRVRNAFSREDARRAARAVAASSLVKAAFFGEDANWGRILCAVGYSGARFQPERVDIFLGPLQVAGDGCSLPFSEERAAEILKEDHIIVNIDLKDGCDSATAWGCDLSCDYVRINGSYRT